MGCTELEHNHQQPTSTASSSCPAGIWQFIRLGSVVFVPASCGWRDILAMADGEWGQPDKVFVVASYKQLSSAVRSSSEVLMISLLGLQSKMG